MEDVVHRFFSDLSTVVIESSGELTILSLILLLFVIVILTGFFVYNRSKKLNKLDRQIPASLVRSYLNSIIKNSSDLKDSLFIDEGKEIAVDSKNDIASLRNELKEKEKIINELVRQKSAAPVAGAPSPIILQDQESDKELEKIIKERDELLLKVSDYKKAEEDLANLKKIKEENEELKRKLGMEVSSPQEEIITVKEEAKPVEEDSKILEFQNQKPQEEIKPAATGEDQEIAKEEKSAEDLLKEFEKMLV